MSVVASNGKGTWREVAVIIDGKNVPLGLSTILLHADEDAYTVTVNGRVYQRGTAKHDYDKSPAQSDVTVTEGPQAGETIPQIFRLEGDVLIACNASPRQERPTEFTSQPGSGHTLSVWLRTEQTPVPGPLTWRTWLLVGILVMLGCAIGGVSQDLEASLGRWAGILAGLLAGVPSYTGIFLLLKKPWQSALAFGILISVASVTFDLSKTTLTPALGLLGAICFSVSTSIVAACIVWAVISRLMKVNL